MQLMNYCICSYFHNSLYSYRDIMYLINLNHFTNVYYIVNNYLYKKYNILFINKSIYIINI